MSRQAAQSSLWRICGLQLVAFSPSRRLSASAALRHPWVTDSALGGTLLKVKQASKRTASAIGVLEGAHAGLAAIRLCLPSGRSQACRNNSPPVRDKFALYEFDRLQTESNANSRTNADDSNVSAVVQGHSGWVASQKHSLQKSWVPATPSPRYGSIPTLHFCCSVALCQCLLEIHNILAAYVLGHSVESCAVTDGP